MTSVALSGKRSVLYEQKPNEDDAGETQLKAIVNYVNEFCEKREYPDYRTSAFLLYQRNCHLRWMAFLTREPILLFLWAWWMIRQDSGSMWKRGTSRRIISIYWDLRSLERRICYRQ